MKTKITAFDETKALVEKSRFEKQADVVKVNTDRDREAAEALIVTGSAYLKRVDAELMEPQRDIKRAVDKAMKGYKEKFIAPVERAVDHLKRQVSTFLVEQDRLREEQQRTENEAAERAAEKERARLAGLAKRTKNPEKKEALEQQAAAVFAVPVIVDKAHGGEGIGYRDDVEVEVLDLRAFAAFVVNSTDSPLDPMVTVKVGGVKEFLKFHGLTECPGLRITKKKIISAGGGM